VRETDPLKLLIMIIENNGRKSKSFFATIDAHGTIISTTRFGLQQANALRAWSEYLVIPDRL
jgi:hypothetical protein